MDPHKKNMLDTEFFTEYGEASRFQIQEVVGKGSYGVVGAAIDTHTGERVAIKKINDVFEHVSDATRILREIKLLRLLRHPDIVEIKHIMLPPSRREFRDIYVVFELMESDLHQVIKANDDLTPEHHQFFLYQLLRSLKYIHSANVFHRDLKPKNILANADCKLKICDFGLARVSFNDAPSAIFWTDYVATRWYRAPELCGSFFSKYTPAIDIWSIGCIFAEMLTGRPLFPGKNVVHQLDLMTDLLGTPSPESIARALADPYFNGLANVDREPSTQPISKLEFEFERRKLAKDDILEYHPQMLQEYLHGADQTNFMYPSGVDRFKRQFAHLEEHHGKGERSTPVLRQHASLPRERVGANKDQIPDQNNDFEKRGADSVSNTLQSPRQSQQGERSDHLSVTDGINRTNFSARSLLKSASISASKCVVVKGRKDAEDTTFCKSILHEYAVKMNIEKPIYTTSQSEGGLLPSFISSLVFDGKTYTGAAGRNKKEAEQMAARAIIESILAHSNTRILMSQIIKSKGKLYAAMQQNSETGLPQQGKAAFGKPARNDSSISTVQGKEIQPAPENDDLVGVANHEQLLLGQLPAAVEAHPFLPAAKKHKKEYPCEQSSGPIGNGTSQPSLAQEKEIQPAPANDDLGGVANHEQLLMGQLPAAAEAHPFLPEANKPREEYPCEQSFGPLGNDTSLTNLKQGSLPSESTSRVFESPNESCHAQQNQVDDLAGPSMQSSEGQNEVPNSCRKCSKKKHKGRHQCKKARTEQYGFYYLFLHM
ncbi:putative Mitogen-activated protein kinase 9 [Cocos nucifera]|uniref:Putative Mitogen-activated protein kinase 9 n=1 Tax=Cocos nucifera TaxID=13894 RepID=A0A8K0NCC4_COCNU|nr:putative Mitogen-activated protein kinase 9 [Cocos nucifera]